MVHHTVMKVVGDNAPCVFVRRFALERGLLVVLYRRGLGRVETGKAIGRKAGLERGCQTTHAALERLTGAAVWPKNGVVQRGIGMLLPNPVPSSLMRWR
jgi:hypothetical protein